MRSLLLVDGDDLVPLSRVVAAGADGLVTTAAAAPALSKSRTGKAVFPKHYVRATSSSADGTTDDPTSMLASRLDGFFLIGARDAGDIVRLAALLAAHEAIAGLNEGTIGIIPVVTTAAGALQAGGLASGGPRLQGLAWDADAIARSLGAESARDHQGRLIGPCETARALCLLAASAAAVPALDTPFSGALEQLEDEARIARHDGFRGKLCTQIEQIPTINTVFTTDR